MIKNSREFGSILNFLRWNNVIYGDKWRVRNDIMFPGRYGIVPTGAIKAGAEGANLPQRVRRRLFEKR